MKDIKTVEEYRLIPIDEIDDDARRIAVKWVEHFTRAGLNIEQKHKLASDIMNYHKAKVNAISDEEIDNFSENNIDYSDDKPKNNNDILILTATRKGVNYGAKWLKNKLLNDL